jgi:beta-N-acetylhexosaminidase
VAERAFITGLAGTKITSAERSFLRESSPWGLILFKRNIATPDRLVALVKDFRDVVGRADAPVLIDQEGGRVSRLGPPHWPDYPPGAAYGRIYERDAEAGLAAARLGAQLIASDLAALGITVDCLPVADVPSIGADPIIGDRAYGATVGQVVDVARAIAQGLLAGGVLPVLKHIPGHGRATVDSHLKLPVVDADRSALAATDFAAFRELADLPFGMTAHVVYAAIDPDRPATTSAIMIDDVIRGLIGFDGALMTDDIAMGALSGSIAQRTRAALAAGCDLILHCNGNLQQMQQVAANVPILEGAPAQRAQRALRTCLQPASFDLAAARAEFSHMMEGVWPTNAGMRTA